MGFGLPQDGKRSGKSASRLSAVQDDGAVRLMILTLLFVSLSLLFNGARLLFVFYFIFEKEKQVCRQMPTVRLDQSGHLACSIDTDGTNKM